MSGGTYSRSFTFSQEDWDSLILLGYRGSEAHGTYDERLGIDDIDLMGFVAPGRGYYHGLESFGSSDTKEIKDGPWDIVLYEAKKAIRLLANGNPNVLSLLWLDHYHVATKAGQLLIQNRHLFMSKRIYHTFQGYAYSQLKKMTHNAHEGYMGEKRKALVAKYGYDTKNAAHLIRLLRMGREALKTGQLNVRRDDAEELLAIKNGRWQLDHIHRLAEENFRLLQEEKDTSPLPDEPDYGKISLLCQQIVELSLLPPSPAKDYLNDPMA